MAEGPNAQHPRLASIRSPSGKPDDAVMQWARVLGDKLERSARERGPEHAGEVLQWLESLNDVDPVAALAVTDRLDRLLSQLDASGLGRWILTGLRLHPGEPEHQRRYFRLEEPLSIEALHGEAGALDLAASIPSLALLLQGLSSTAMRVQPRHQTQLNGVALRPVLTPSHLLLPDDYTFLDGSDRYRLFQAAVAHAVAHLRYSPRSQPTTTLKPMSVAIVSAIEDARVERLIVGDYPGVRNWFVPSLERAIRYELSFAALVSRMNFALMNPVYEDDNHWVNKARRLFEQQAGDLSDYAAFRRLASILANDLGQMRVRFHPQDVVSAPYRDDNSFLWDHGEPKTPQPEQDLHVQGRAFEFQPRRATESNEAPEGPQPEVEVGRASYPEWDHRMSRARPDWCTVIEKLPAWQGRPAGAAPAPSSLQTLAALTRSRRLSRVRRLRRQWEGDDIDLNAAIEVMVDQRMDLSPDPRLFMRPGREERVSSLLVLLDLSESTNDCLAGSMQSILDIEKKAALLLAQSALHGQDRVAIHGFSSNTRAEVNYYRLLDAATPLDARAVGRVRSVSGRYSTRMGAALRHATAHMAHEPGDHRSILLVTDGAPSDVDVFEADYLIEDARVAVLDARRLGIQAYCVVLDPKADAYAHRIFGWRNYRIVDDPRLLPVHLSELYARLSAS